MSTLLGENIKSITETKRELSKIITDTKVTGKPTYIFNHNKPQAVILSTEQYENLVNKTEELSEQNFYLQVNNRVQNGTNRLISSDEVINDAEINPFDGLTDEELFD